MLKPAGFRLNRRGRACKVRGMRIRLGWLLAALCALNPGATRGWSAGRPTATTAHGGRDYIRVSDWAKANDFTVRWTRKEEVLQLSNRSASITLNVDSNEAEVSGIGVRLCFPVAYREGT